MLQGFFQIAFKIVKYASFLFIFTFLANIFSYAIYHVYYGTAIVLSYFMSYQALNIISYSAIGFVAFIIHDYFFKD